MVDLAELALDRERWQQAAHVVKTTKLAAERLTLASHKPKSWDEVLSQTYSGEMRANILTLAHYLAEQGLPPTLQTTDTDTVRRLFHHGDLEVTGSLLFLRKSGAPACNAITGHLGVRGELTGSAFDSELMVGGDVDCGAFVCDAEVGVGGVIRCRYARLGWYDCTIACAALEAEVFVDHGMVVEGEVRAQLVFHCEDHSTGLPAGERHKLDLLTDDIKDAVLACGDDDDAAYAALDEAARAAVAAGRPLLRDPRP